MQPFTDPTLTAQTVGAALQGFGMGAGLIIAIGAQNAFVLAQGVRREHHMSVALLCSLCDAALILLGVCGMGSLVAAHPAFIRLASWAGALFLFFYGLRSFAALRTSQRLKADCRTGADGRCPSTLQKTLLTTLALTLLNPHVYLDTVLMLGSISSRFEWPVRGGFGAGAMLASFCWFFALAWGGRLLAPWFARPQIWRVLDFTVGCTMWFVALSLVL